MPLIAHKFPDRMFIDVEGLPLKALYGVCLKGGKTMAWGQAIRPANQWAADSQDTPGAGRLAEDMGPDYA